MTSNETESQHEAERMAALEQVLHVVEMPDGFHVVQIPGEAGSTLTHWVGPQINRAAAEMQRSALVHAATNADMTGCFSDSVKDYFDLAGRIEEILNTHDGDVRSVALFLTQETPWEKYLHHRHAPRPF